MLDRKDIDSSGGVDIRRAARLCVHDLFAGQARSNPNAVALRQDGRTSTYGQLHSRVLRLAAALRAQGVRHGDRIALISENRFEYVEIQLAAAFLGAIVACQNWRLAVPEIQSCVDLVSPVLIIVSRRFAPLLDGIEQRGVPALVIEERHEAMIAQAAPLAGHGEVDAEDGLLILYTSGTTGMPKGALISHRAEVARMAVMHLTLRVTDDAAFVAWAPLFHMASSDHALATLMAGATVHVVDGFDVPALVTIMEENRLGWLLLMPGAIEPVIGVLKASGKRPKGIQVTGAMADLVPRRQIAELTRLLGAPYFNSFGSTETGLAPAGSLLAPGASPSSLAKRATMLCEMRLVDGAGKEVADGEPGEAVVRGPTMFSGYWNAPEANRRDFRDGWFHMGDLFRRNADGGYDFVDRTKYMIKSGGENIYPAEIERVLLAEPAISDAVVVRKRDPRWGEVPVAFIARSDETMTEARVEALCRRSLAGYKRPKEVHFIGLDEFPRSTTGKILRHELEQRLISGSSGAAVMTQNNPAAGSSTSRPTPVRRRPR